MARAADSDLRSRRGTPLALAVITGSDVLPLASALLDDPRLVGVLGVEGFSPEQARALSVRLPRRPTVRRPLHPLLSPRAELHRELIADYREKDRAVARLSDWASGLGVSTRTVSSLEQAADELLLNALFDAPVDGSGRPRYEKHSAEGRLHLQALPGEEAELAYAADEHRLVVSIRDRCGTLRRDTVLKYLIRCAQAQLSRRSPLEQKGAGAGVGLYLAASGSSEIAFRLRRGRCTEATCVVYRLRPRPLRALVIDDDAS